MIARVARVATVVARVVARVALVAKSAWQLGWQLVGLEYQLYHDLFEQPNWVTVVVQWKRRVN